MAGLGAALTIGGWQVASGDELLVNGGFESGTTGWDTPYGELTTVSFPVHGGSASGRLRGESPATKSIQQWVNVGPGQTYEFSGWVLLDDPSISNVLLRIHWYDANGSLLPPVDSPWLTGSDSSFRFLSTGSQASPSGVHKARLSVVVQPSGPFQVYLDDFSLQGAPPAPSPTAIPISTPTSLPTSTPTPAPAQEPTSSQKLYPTPSPPTPLAPFAAVAEPTLFPSLVNGGFEDVRQDGTPYGWRKIGGEMRASSVTSAEGELSASLLSRTESTKWLYQAVGVEGGSYYRLRAMALKNDPPAREVLLRISWYASADGSGSQLSTVDSPALAADSPEFVALDTGPVRAPPEARSAKVRLLLRPKSATPAVVYFDDVRFEVAAAPPDEDEADGGQQARSETADRGGMATGDAQQAAEAEVLSVWTGPTALANVKQEREQPATLAESGGRPSWPLLLAFGVPAAGLTVMVGSAWRRPRLAERNKRHL